MSQKKPMPMDEDALQLVARRFAVLGEPTRLRILQALMTGERPVGEIVDATGGTQTNISRHLQTLAATGLVARRREGLQVFYAVADPMVHELCALVCGGLRREFADRAARFG
ncbi:metalloregulator ArsR/SmtB family transcription factor [Termitidicoccus mucosus]|uniref:ArsR family transcriptional regulator n=1 Tax=Termitidicoccus mucosus TaxID=1184151 RepID=A0A178IIG1_9BACT|nr:ArsR family transcriptional regulator [Opitutaceae bacterium TSB47]